jgi:DNA (cytosine-5)-methyltransferase 1
MRLLSYPMFDRKAINDMAIHTVEFFAGVGMLGEGVRAGLEYLGIPHRNVCYVEREAHAASVLVARMEEGSLDTAPVWSDVTTFPAEQFRGKVDGIVAGFPCQDISVAGARKGLDGHRSGLFFEIPRLADDCGAWFLFLENVAGIASATSSVVDEAEGDLDERAASRVVGELADLGWNAEWIVVSASDVGANHGRARWFCLAWRKDLDDTEGGSVWGDIQNIRQAVGKVHCIAGAGHDLGHADMQHGDLQQWKIRTESDRTNGELADSASLGRKAGSRLSRAENSLVAAQQCEFGAGDPCGTLADTGSAGRQGNELGGAHQGGARPYVSVSEFCGLFAPGPSDQRWRDILDEFPELAPALESAFRSVVNGLAFDMGDSRAARLKCAGNGVVPLCAAVAFVVLAHRAGLFQEQESRLAA